MHKYVVLFFSSLVASLAFAAVDLNTATQSQLEEVNGIGPAKAKAIIDYRTKNGVFKSFDDLDKVPGFGKATLDRLKGEVVVGGKLLANSTTGAAKGGQAPKPKNK